MINEYVQMNASTNLDPENRKSKSQLSITSHSVSRHALSYLTDQTPIVVLPVDVDACGSSGLTNEFTAALAASQNA